MVCDESYILSMSDHIQQFLVSILQKYLKSVMKYKKITTCWHFFKLITQGCVLSSNIWVYIYISSLELGCSCYIKKFDGLTNFTCQTFVWFMPTSHKKFVNICVLFNLSESKKKKEPRKLLFYSFAIQGDTVLFIMHA